MRTFPFKRMTTTPTQARRIGPRLGLPSSVLGTSWQGRSVWSTPSERLPVTAHQPLSSKIEARHRIAVTEDIELFSAAGFSDIQLGAFRELADLLRDLLTRTDAVSVKTEE